MNKTGTAVSSQDAIGAVNVAKELMGAA